VNTSDSINVSNSQSNNPAQGASTIDLTTKQKQFQIAIDLFKSNAIYSLIGNLTAIMNISLQLYLLWCVFKTPVGIAWQVVALVVSLMLADFVNGLVHLYMDQNDDYTSFVGPIVANFHLHHKTPKYEIKSLPVVYFKESGSKIWLVVYLFSIVIFTNMLNHVVLHILVYIGILSLVAEVSHYLCHTSKSKLAIFLGNIRILLPKSHHYMHHLNDNMNYAFLNGLSDPLINWIAKTWYKAGYKNATDLHYAHYANGSLEQR
jgi:hypothetical protein